MPRRLRPVPLRLSLVLPTLPLRLLPALLLLPPASNRFNTGHQKAAFGRPFCVCDLGRTPDQFTTSTENSAAP